MNLRIPSLTRPEAESWREVWEEEGVLTHSKPRRRSTWKTETTNLLPLYFWLGSMALPTVNLASLSPDINHVAGFWLAVTSFAPMFWSTDPVIFLGGAVPNLLLLLGTMFVLMKRPQLGVIAGIGATLGAGWSGITLWSSGLLIGYWVWLASCISLVGFATRSILSKPSKAIIGS